MIPDEELDAVMWVLTDEPETVSTIGRRAHVSTAHARHALSWLVAERMAVPSGNGAWTRYRGRRAGETARYELDSRGYYRRVVD